MFVITKNAEISRFLIKHIHLGIFMVQCFKSKLFVEVYQSIGGANDDS